MTNEEISEYLTIGEVSKLLKVHPNTLRNWDKNGILRPIRIGERKLRRYKKEDIIKFLNSGQEIPKQSGRI